MGFIVCNLHFKEKFGSISFEHLLEQIIKGEEVSKFYFVAATNQLAWSFRMSFVEKFYSINRRAVSNFVVSNLDGLIRLIYSNLKAPNKKKILSDSLRFLIFKEAFDEAPLNFFKRHTNEKVSLFVVKWLSQIIFGLKEDGITLENFEFEMNNAAYSIVNTLKFNDTKILFEYYQNKLTESNFFDIIDATYFVSDTINQFVESGNSNSIFNSDETRTFLFFGFYDFKMPEIKFLSSLAKLTNPVAIFLDFDETNGPLFGNYIDLLLNLKNSGFITFSLDTNSFNSNTNFVKKYLFNYYLGQTRPELAKRIRICSTENRYSETKEIAKLCKYLILRKNIKPSEICIVTKNPQSYSPLFREVFQDAGIPANITERFRLSSSPLVISILSAIDVVTYGFRFKDVRKVLLSFYFRFYNQKTSQPIDVENLLGLASKMKILGGREFNGKKYWESRFRNRLKVIEQRLETLNSLDYPDPMEITSLRTEQQAVERAKEDFEAFTAYFDFPEKDISFEDFYEIVTNKIIKRFGVLNILENVANHLVENLNLYSKYDKIEKIEEIERDTRALTKFLKVLEEFVFTSSIRYKDKKFSIEEIADLFKVVIFDERYQLSRKPNAGVTITTIEQTRGIPFKVMILCGAIDGEIPLRYSPEKFLGRVLGKSEKRHFQNECLEFYFFLTNNNYLFDRNERWTYIFFPKRDSKREFIPSPFIHSLCELIGVNFDDFVIELAKFSPNEHDCEGMEWVSAITSLIENNILEGDSAETSLEGLKFDVTELYYRRLRENNLLESKLSDEAKEFISKLISRPLSVSFFEDYVRCPYQFFVNRILQISKPAPEMEIFLSNREKGEILHLIVSNFFKELAQIQSNEAKNFPNLKLGNKVFVPVILDPNKKEEYIERIKSITSSVLKKFDTEISLFEIDFEEFFSTELGRIGYVQLWLSYELQRANWEFKPILFELGIGLNTKDSLDPVTIEYVVGDNFDLRGKIDRIDFYETEDKFELLVIDYKLKAGECKTQWSVKNGESFQMPLYAIALKNIFERNGIKKPIIINLVYQIFDFKVSDENDYVLNYKSFAVDSSSVLGKYFPQHRQRQTSLDQIIQFALFNANEVLRSIKENKSFNVKPIDNGRVCQYCSFQSICKIENY